MEISTSQQDSLTGLVNRLGLEAALLEADALGKRNLTLFSVQISRFGSINSSLGGAVADRIIVMTARRLQKTFPAALQIARTHGDHFCLLFEGLESIDETIRRLDDFTRRPFAVSGEVIVLSVRIGVAQIGDSLPLSALLLCGSEIALDAAKKTKTRVQFYMPEMEQQARDTHRFENDLRVSLVNRHAELHRALANEEFHLYYQPIINCRTGQIHAFEALIRWLHPEKGFISPATFIPLAEQIQVMDVLGGWVIQRAIADAASWPDAANDHGVGVSINISASQFIEPAILLNQVSRALENAHFDPSRVKLEVTESSAFVDTMDNALQSLRGMGCKIGLDDFGTGYSSLTQLHQLPLDYLKLDRSFIKDLDSESAESSRRSHKLTLAILSLAETFGIDAVVEGVETQRQLDAVRDMGASLIQGFIYSKPLPACQIPQYINTFCHGT